ncbi:MAG: RluA family pseudouridine synthase [Deltaproteobacteria bacterium]|nr:RluA family pseudouridine synthase [Deltaproteobacteria bacterium]MBW2199806.1 RluA family pseudouridine synthase [Deltaproteobacteria bacterium]MBW2537990.1 RluA family pseudouridine synthase [Deltaproteobacteria bacterium]
MPSSGAFTILVHKHESGTRLDTLLTSRIDDFSRSHAAHLILKGSIRVDGTVKKPGYRVKPGDEISVFIPPPKPVDFNPEPIKIDILYEDKHLIVVNKKPGIVVHPAPGHYSGTLVNALLYHCPDLEGIGAELRPGIVHRLDQDTSGAIVIAKGNRSHRNLASQFKSRKVKKNYLALVYGDMESESGVISFAIGRHPVDRKKMSIQSRKGRTAETRWQARERFSGFTLLDLILKTGRTHQIRVHCAAIHHPIVGDSVYCGRKVRKKLAQEMDMSGSIDSVAVSRQMLHAWRLEFTHPITQECLSIEAPIPKDMADLIDVLRKTKNVK